ANAGNDQTLVVNQEDDLKLVTLSSKNSTDIDGTISNIEWRNANNEQLSASSTMVTSLPVGIHKMTLKVIDNEGASDTDSVTVTINSQPIATADDVPPSVSLTSPSNHQTTSGVVTVSTKTSDNVGVVAVKFFLDGSQLSNTDTTPPYAISWNTLQETNGAYTLIAKAYDAAGNVATSTPVKGVIDNVIITNSGLINPQVKPARTTCVAPCSIFFDASATTSATTKRPFHELNYRWNFDDAGAGKWAWTGKSRNKTTGAVTTHVFESAGVYNVALLVRDVDGNTATKQTTITIVDPDSFYSDNKTFCFSKSSDFSGCPTSLASQHITTSNIQVVENYVGSGKRLLLHRGDSWSTDNSIKLIGPGPSVLGAFGTCLSADARGICANAPKIKITNASSQGISSSWNNPMVDWRVMDIELSGPSNSKDHGFAARHNNQHILLLRMNIHDFYGLVYADNSSTYTNGNVTVANSKLIHSIGGQGANNMWYSGNNMSILGNEVNDSRETEHVIRSPYLNGGVISNNVLLNQAPYKHVLKLHAPDWSKFGLYSQKIVISDNKFKSSNLDSASWIVAIQPQRCNNDDPTDERIRNVVVERNLFEAGTYTQVGLIVGSRDVTIRNNLFNMAKGKFQRVVQVGQCNIEPKPLNVGVINNSFYSTYTGDFTAIAINSTATNTAVVNNLAYAPNSSNPRLFSGSAFAQNN
ncbi:MAG: Ig-like domain-containing protein, partial [Thiotrichaceae bacterium]